MRIKFIAIAGAFMCLTLAGSANDSFTVSKEDSILLDNALVQLVESIEADKMLVVKGLSAEKIYCVMCVWEIDKKQAMHHSYMVPIDSFIKRWHNDFAQSPVLKQYHKRGYSLSILPAEQYAPESKDAPDIYEAWIQTYLPDEMMPGHKGWRQAFQFVKVDGKFKFSGFDSVPQSGYK